jgi:glycoside/pentoside/hexuronide:cation symporter, GPH family
MKKKVESFPLWGQILYSSGYIGFTIADRIWVTFMLYFYLPPKESGMPELISNQTFLWILTVAGVATIFGRVVDAITNPLVASWSDSSTSKLGRRRFFLIYGGLPLMAATSLLFFPPSDHATLGNAFYMALMLGCLLFFFTFYVTPWLALIPELSHTNEERINITTMQAAFSLVGIVVVMIGGYALWGELEGAGIEKVRALQYTIVVLSVLGLVFCYLCIIPINEKRYSATGPAQIGMWDSLKLTFKNRPFIPYLIGTICLWFGLNVVSESATYYVTVLLGKPETFASIVFASVFGVALVFFPIINILSRIIGKKMIMIVSLAVFAVCAVLIYFLGNEALILSPVNQAFIIFGIMGIPVSALLAVPNAMIADLAEYDAVKTGINRDAMYFGAQGLVQKVNLGVATLVLAYLFAAFGKDVSNPMGIRVSGFVTAFVCILGIIVYLFYPEKKIMQVLEESRAASRKG